MLISKTAEFGTGESSYRWRNTLVPRKNYSALCHPFLGVIEPWIKCHSIRSSLSANDDRLFVHENELREFCFQQHTATSHKANKTMGVIVRSVQWFACQIWCKNIDILLISKVLSWLRKTLNNRDFCTD